MEPSTSPPNKVTRENATRQEVTRPRAIEIPEQPAFRLLSLPAEVRNMIYRLLVVPSKRNVSDSHIWFRPYLGKVPYDVSVRYIPAIMLLNRQARAEYLAAYFDIVELLVNIWDVDFSDQSWKELQELPIQLAFEFDPDIFESTYLSEQHLNQVELFKYEMTAKKMLAAVRGLITVLKAMPRLNSLKLLYWDWLLIIAGYEQIHPHFSLGPFTELRGLRKVSVEGDVSDRYAAYLRSSITRPKSSLVNKIGDEA